MKIRKARRLVVVSIGVLLLVMLITLALRQAQSRASLNTLRFSNTAVWGAEYVGYIQRAFTTKADMTRISLPNPPSNDSEEVRVEIDELRRLQDIRTNELESVIREEITLAVADFYGEAMENYFDVSLHPETAPALRYAWGDLETLIMREKNRFDRVRPPVIAPDLIPPMEVPAHPAYPSGHATQAYFFALVLSDIYPERSRAYISRADEIARHRELAGVHYRSDSLAGELLARQFHAALSSDPAFEFLKEEGRNMRK